MYGASVDTVVPPLPTPGVHALLAGLDADDHPQYALADGSRGDFAATTHTHTASQITDFGEAVDDRLAGLVIAGTNVTVSYDDAAGTFTINANTAGSHTHTTTDITDFAEGVDDRVAALVVAGTGLSKTYDDAAGTLTLSISSVPSHSHTAANITDFSEAVDDRVAALLVAGTNVTLFYDDAADTFTISANSAGSHTHTTADITDFSEAVDDRVAGLVVAGNGITKTYDDGAGTLTIAIDSASRMAHGATYSAFVALTDGATITIDWSAGNQFRVTLGGNRTIAFVNLQTGQLIRVRLQQDATGSRTVTWPAGISWAGGAAPTLTTTANKADWIGLICTDSATPTFDGGPGWGNL
jgi:hypothetical protein